MKSAGNCAKVMFSLLLSGSAWATCDGDNGGGTICMAGHSSLAEQIPGIPAITSIWGDPSLLAIPGSALIRGGGGGGTGGGCPAVSACGSGDPGVFAFREIVIDPHPSTARWSRISFTLDRNTFVQSAAEQAQFFSIEFEAFAGSEELLLSVRREASGNVFIRAFDGVAGGPAFDRSMRLYGDAAFRIGVMADTGNTPYLYVIVDDLGTPAAEEFFVRTPVVLPEDAGAATGSGQLVNLSGFMPTAMRYGNLGASWTTSLGGPVRPVITLRNLQLGIGSAFVPGWEPGDPEG